MTITNYGIKVDFACRFHGISFQNTRPKNGFFLDENALSGWNAPASRIRERVQRVGAGEFFLPGTRGGKTVQLSGALVAPSKLEAYMLRDQLNAIPLSYGWLIVEEPTTGEHTSTRAWAALTDEPTVGMIRGNCNGAWAPFTFSLQLPEPYRYGRKRKYLLKPGQSVTVENYGVVPALPRVTVNGPASSVALAIGGVTTSLTAEVRRGETAIYDAVTELYSRSTGAVYFSAVNGDRLSIPLGESKLTATVISGSYPAEMVIEYWETYL